MYFGAHVGSGGGVWKAVDEGVELGCEAIQIFAGSPRTWRPTLYKERDAARFREARAASPIRFVVIHTIYLINLATVREDFYEKSIVSLVGALTAADQLGAEAIVTHIGSHLGAGFEAGLERVGAALRRALAEAGDPPVRLLLENTAGAGSHLGSRFEELASIRERAGEITSLPIGYCLDTCHLLAAGFDIATPAGLRATVGSAERQLGMVNVRVFHVNDSKTPLGSRVDRHANIGEGYIPLAAFRRILKHPKLRGKPFILETPIVEPGDDRRNLDTLKSLVRISHTPRPGRSALGRKPGDFVSRRRESAMLCGR